MTNHEFSCVTTARKSQQTGRMTVTRTALMALMSLAERTRSHATVASKSQQTGRMMERKTAPTVPTRMTVQEKRQADSKE